MRILRLELAGFGPFRDRQTIDFAELSHQGLFLIAGKTGSGKSSILDAVVYALYDFVPRFDKKSDEIRSRFCSPTQRTQVVLEFSHLGRDFRITRSPAYERPSQRGDGFVVEKAAQSFEEYIDGSWQVMATKARDVDAKRTELFPLTAQQFLQVIMLAQGRFQEFLHASSSQRQALLRTLFASGRFDAYAEIAKKRADELLSTLNTTKNSLKELARAIFGESNDPEQELTTSALTSRTAANVQAVADAATAHQAAATAHEQAAEHERSLSQTHQNQLARNARREELRRLEEERSEIAEQVQAPLANHERATQLLPLIREVTRREQRVTTLNSQLLDQQARLRDVLVSRTTDQLAELSGSTLAAQLAAGSERSGTAQAIDTVELDEVIDACSATIHEITTAEQLTATSNELTRVVATLTDKRDSAQADLHVVTEAIRQLPEQIETAHAELSEQSEQLTELERVPERLERARANRNASERASKLKLAADKLTDELAASLTQQENAVRHERELVGRRLQNSAAALAQQLVAGSPCAVCGSIEHPNPAGNEGESVDDEMLRTAAEAVKHATEHTNQTRDRLTSATTEREALISSTDGHDIEHWDHEIATLRVLLEQRARLASERDNLTARLTDLRQQLKDAQQREQPLRTAVDTTSIQLVEAETTLREHQHRIALIAGSFPSPQAKLTASTELREHCSTLRNLYASLDHALTEREQAQERSDAAIAQSEFSDAAQVVAAVLDESTAARLTARLQEHTRALAAVETYLARPEVRQLPEALVDTSSATAAAAEALQQRELTQRDLTIATAQRDREHDLIERATSLLAVSEETLDEAELWDRLARDLRGQNEYRQSLESYVLAAFLEEIVSATNVRLQHTTQGRYELALDDSVGAYRAQSGLGINVIDLYNGATRPATSLSGGETFLVSLSLALGLADVVSSNAGGVSLETLFIDEGFGSLDPQTLEVAMQTLDQLRSAGRVVGVISHVPAMHDRIPTRVEVCVGADRSSTIRVTNAGE